jgi:bacillithiol biosynthesis deacetylase BshB1
MFGIEKLQDQKQNNFMIDILVFAAHPDDAELACSGTIVKHIKQGKKVVICDLTQGQLGSRGNSETRLEEAKASAKILQLTERINLGFRDGFFEVDEQHLLEVVKIIRHYQPKVILCNAPSDRHPDHGRASELVSRANFLAGLLKIETDYHGKTQTHYRTERLYKYIQDRYLQPDFVIDITPEMETKMQSILAFSSQFYKEGEDASAPQTPISSKEFIEFVKARSREFGRNIGVEFGEGFITERPLSVNDITTLL